MYGITPIYKVGGSVRDSIMGREPNDIDYTTPMTPEEMTSLIKAQGKKVYEVGARFGTIGFKHEGEKIEVTTFRSESYDGSSRKPSVEFVRSLQEDLARRDFTINAMAEDEDGNIVDPFGGRNDIEDKLVRAVGNPETRFKEDPLRMLRAIRFAAQFDFSIDQRTFDAIRDKAHRILNVSKERWMMELDKILLSEHPTYGLYLLWHTRLINFMIPELAVQYNYDQNNPHHRYPLHQHTILVMNNFIDDVLYASMVEPEDRVTFMWAVLLHDVGKPFVRVDKIDRSSYAKHDLVGAEIVESIAFKLKWSNARRKTVVELVRDHMSEDSPMKEFDRGGKA